MIQRETTASQILFGERGAVDAAGPLRPEVSAFFSNLVKRCEASGATLIIGAPDHGERRPAVDRTCSAKYRPLLDRAFEKLMVAVA